MFIWTVSFILSYESSFVIYIFLKAWMQFTCVGSRLSNEVALESADSMVMSQKYAINVTPGKEKHLSKYPYVMQKNHIKPNFYIIHHLRLCSHNINLSFDDFIVCQVCTINWVSRIQMIGRCLWKQSVSNIRMKQRETTYKHPAGSQLTSTPVTDPVESPAHPPFLKI